MSQDFADFLNAVANGISIKSTVHPARRYATGYFQDINDRVTVAVTWQSGMQEHLSLEQFLKDYNAQHKEGKLSR